MDPVSLSPGAMSTSSSSGGDSQMIGRKRERTALGDITESSRGDPPRDAAVPALKIGDYDSPLLASPEACAPAGGRFVEQRVRGVDSDWATINKSASLTAVERLKAAASCLKSEQSRYMLSATGDRLEGDGGEVFGSSYGGHTWHVLARLKEQEHLRQQIPPYMGKHQQLNAKMRNILVSWLMEVEMLEITSKSGRTLYMAVQIIDRFLALTDKPVGRKNLQLVGIAAYVIAHKCEVGQSEDADQQLPMAKAAMFCDGAYTTQQLVSMEKNILLTLNFDVNLPTPVDFLDFFCAASTLSTNTVVDLPTRAKFTSLCHFLSEVSLLNLGLSTSYPSSVVASASTLLAQKLTNISSWDATLLEFSGHTEQDLQTCMMHLHNAAVKCCNGDSVLVQKYSSPRFQNVCSIFKGEYIIFESY